MRVVLQQKPCSQGKICILLDRGTWLFCPQFCSHKILSPELLIFTWILLALVNRDSYCHYKGEKLMKITHTFGVHFEKINFIYHPSIFWYRSFSYKTQLDNSYITQLEFVLIARIKINFIFIWSLLYFHLELQVGENEMLLD